MIEFFPEKIKKALANTDLNKLTEIRFRNGAPIKVLYDFKKYFLGENYLTLYGENAIVCTNELIESIIYSITEYSLYAANERIKQGFITTKDGVRIGIAGDCVFDNGRIVTVKNFSSLCIRLPHRIRGAADKLCESAFKDGLKNTLVISAPGYGKTTILKDIIEKYSAHYEILVIDERGELSVGLTNCADVIRFSDKRYAFDYGIRSLAPEIVVTDELSDENDWKCAEKAASSGVKIIATSHGENVTDVTAKAGFVRGVFERYAVLESSGRAGRLKQIFDANFNELI